MTYTTSEITEECGKSLRSVCNWAKRNNVKRDGRFWVFEEKDRAAILDYYGVQPANEANEPTNEANELPNEANEASMEANEANEPSGNEANESNELPNEANEGVNLALAILQKELEAKDKTIAELLEMQSKLLAKIDDKDETIKQLSSGYVSEKIADSAERVEAIQPASLINNTGKKISLRTRFKILFTGEE